jgi:inner membrane protein
MYRRGHIGLGLLFGAPIACIAGLGGHPLYMGVAFGMSTITSFIPDIDQRLPVLNHRGITHTVWFGIASVFVVGAGFLFLLNIPLHTRVPSSPAEILIQSPGLSVTVLVSGFAGFGSHLIGDMLTEAYDYTITPFWPVFDEPYTFGVTTADSTFWNWGFFVSGVLSVFLVIVAVASVL